MTVLHTILHSMAFVRNDPRRDAGALWPRETVLGATGNENLPALGGARSAIQPCRPLKRGLSLLITYTRPRRRTTWAPGWFLSDLIDARTFMVSSLLIMVIIINIDWKTPDRKRASLPLTDVTLIVGHRDHARTAVARRRARAQRCAHVTAVTFRHASTSDVAAFMRDLPSTGRLVVEIPAEAAVQAVIGAFDDEESVRLAELVCVVDAETFFDDLMADDYVSASYADGTLYVAGALRLVQHIEHASSVLVTGWESVETRDLSILLATLSHLAPAASISLERSASAATPEPHSEQAHQPGWVHLLNDEHDPYMRDARVSAFRYERLRPFHPGRLHRLLDDEFGGGRLGAIIRSAGFCRLATRPGIVGSWDQVGQMISLEPLARDDDSSTTPLALGQDLAFIGIDLDVAALSAALDSALLDDKELTADARTWMRFADPLPQWTTHAHSDD